MKKTMIGLALVLVAAAAVAFSVSPSLRTRVIGKVGEMTQWTPEAIEKDPSGYSQYVERQLKKDYEKLNESRKNLTARMNDLANKIANKRQLLEKGQALADEIADAIEGEVFPAAIAGREYSESQLHSQLSLAITQMDAVTESLSELEKIQKAAEIEYEEIVKNLEKTESQLSLIAARREIFKSETLTAEGLEMIETCNAALERNQTVFENNPVRTIGEMIDDMEAKESRSTDSSDERVEQYLSEYRAKKSGKEDAAVQTQDVPDEPARNQEGDAEEAAPKQEQSIPTSNNKIQKGSTLQTEDIPAEPGK